MAEDHPRLRNLEAFPVEEDGERSIALPGSGGFTDKVVALPMPLLEVVSLFDGEHSLEQIHAIVKGRHGEAPTVEQIASIARSLDDNGFLDSPKFAERQRATEEAFRLSPTRPAVHAGGAYAGEPGALASQIDGFFTHRRRAWGRLRARPTRGSCVGSSRRTSISTAAGRRTRGRIAK